jgi:2-keto-4-pentenoate hydratase/2-oxohepta-3-ene-1,7-dioic acid hydratase in catechol pathway
MLDIIGAGEAALTELRTLLGADEFGQELVDAATVEMLAPIPRPPKIVAIGLNYMDHCRETNSEPPKRPLLFAKYPSSVTGHNAPIEWSAGDTEQVDYEAELAVIIGKRAKAVKAAKDYEFIFGYTALNDVSARDLQFTDVQWVRGKSLDTFCPMGPHLVTRDEVPDPQNLRIVCRVNGAALQDSNTSEMIFDIPALIEYITRSITLEPGDVIATGTPSGVGFSRKPPVYLKRGDEVEVYIERIGSLFNHVRVVEGNR